MIGPGVHLSKVRVWMSSRLHVRAIKRHSLPTVVVWLLPLLPSAGRGCRTQRKRIRSTSTFLVWWRQCSADWRSCGRTAPRCASTLAPLRSVHDNIAYHGIIFTARRSCASAVLGVVILSVCPSVRLSVRHTRALWLIQRTYRRYFYTT